MLPLDKTFIKAVGVFLLFGALIAFLAGITLLLPHTSLDAIWKINPSAYEELQPFATIAGIGFILFSPLLIIIGYGLLTLKNWGYKLAIIILGANALGDIGNLLRGEVLKGLAGVIIVSLLLTYLLKKSIRSQFSKTK